jgi:hypothetical protein
MIVVEAQGHISQARTGQHRGGQGMIERAIPVAAAAAVLLAVACGDLTGWRGGDTGTLSFDYSGVEAGTFSVRGSRPENWSSRPHAAGQRLDSPVYIQVFALGDRHQFFLGGRVSEPGTYPLADDHAEGTFYGEFALDTVTSENTARAIYVLISGSVTLEPERGGRIRGTFAGAARLLNGSAVIEITDGRFDVPDNLPRPVE